MSQAGPPLHCPACASPLAHTSFRGTPLARCGACGGTWLSFGQLEALKGQPVELSLLEGHTSHLCARCLTTLSCALLPGSIPVETCGTCRGTYLEAGELEEFLADSAGGGTAWSGTHGFDRTFECARCQRRLPVSEGNALRQQLVCRTCLAGSDVQPHRAWGPQELQDFASRLFFNPYILVPLILLVYFAGHFLMGPDFWPQMCKSRYAR